MPRRTPNHQTQNQRTRMIWDAALGFLGFFTVLALIQAVINVLHPDPQVWPALLAAALLVLSWAVWRLGPYAR